MLCSLVSSSTECCEVMQCMSTALHMMLHVHNMYKSTTCACVSLFSSSNSTVLHANKQSIHRTIPFNPIPTFPTIMIYSLTSAALVAVSFTSVLVDAAPASVQARQNINLCTPIVPSRADSVLTGSKINFSAGNGLFFNATFPTRDFSKDFTGVELAYKINNKDWTVSEWYVQEAPNNEWKIS